MEADSHAVKCAGCGKMIDSSEQVMGVCTRCDGIFPPRKVKQSTYRKQEKKHHGSEKE